MGRPAGPNSWVFFVVAEIAGRHRSVAVVSSMGDNDPSDSLQGYPLTACCRRIITIFADPTNHIAIRAELALAASFYTEHGSNSDYGGTSVELPELNRRRDLMSIRERQWDRTHVPEFPFIATCLVHGVGFDPHTRRTAPILLEPLGTVYRDDSVEWGMVVIDITHLETVRYGIVGFTVDMAKFIPSLEAERRTAFSSMGALGPGAFEEGDDLRVVEDPRPRRALSAAEYMTKFGYKAPLYESGIVTRAMLAQIPLVDVNAMSVVWPLPSTDNRTLLTLSDPFISPPNSERTQQSQLTTQLIQRVIDLNHINESVLTEVRSIPNFKGLLRHHLIRHHSDGLARSPSTQCIGQLVRLAFTHNNHLSLEQLKHFSTDLILVAWNVLDRIDNDSNNKLTSVSLCVDSVQGTPAELADIISQLDTLREIYLLQNPTQECDNLSIRLLEELAARPPVLSRAKVILAGAYSSALRKRLWLPTATSSSNPIAIQSALLAVFPIQHILVRHGRDLPQSSPDRYIYHSVSLYDGLLKPQQFASGFLLYLSTLLPDDYFNPKAQVFSFSSCPASLAADPSSAAEVSPILAENFALPDSFPDDTACSPLVRDLVPQGWTVVVSQEIYQLPRGMLQQQEHPYYIRYAFVRPLQHPIAVDHPPPPERLGPEDLEVVGLKEFLAITSPEVDPAIIDRRLAEVQQQLATWWGNLSNVKPLSVLTQTEAVEILLDSLAEARRRKKRLRELMAEDSEGKSFLTNYDTV